MTASSTVDRGRDLLFGVTGGIAPYTWTDNSAMPPAPFGCAQAFGGHRRSMAIPMRDE